MNELAAQLLALNALIEQARLAALMAPEEGDEDEQTEPTRLS